ncbi:capsular polysaccharide biosynthesis protein [Mucinivorans hirudinis]|uniref:Capsular polysaccharide biosynthesis protein n=1 Tax=Mucinivorans hirudinis TaxID=1433126 RepID=A0A060RAZ2_9BACT|nr:capsular polysaccharide biosynthesis protein [Mucinivorans hirudinis]
MIRVLHCIGGLNNGGMGTMLMAYLRALNRQEVIFDFLVTTENGFFDQEVRTLGGKVFCLTARRKNPIKHYREVDKFFDEHPEYQIVHFHQCVSYWYNLQSAYRHGVKNRIIHNHGIGIDLRTKFPYNIFTKYYAKKRICFLASDYITCADAKAKELFTKDIVKKREYLIMPNAIDANKYRFNEQTRKTIRNKYDIKDSTLVVGHVGNYLYPKNHKFIVDIFSELIKIEDDCVLMLVGDGELRKEIENRISKLGISAKVLLMGAANNVNEFLQAMDVFLFPSIFEGLPLALIEAQTSGVKSIISDVIPLEVSVVQDCIETLPLTDGAQIWAEKIILSVKNHHREDNYDKIVKGGFDIHDNALRLENYYKSRVT